MELSLTLRNRFAGIMIKPCNAEDLRLGTGIRLDLSVGENLSVTQVYLMTILNVHKASIHW